MSVRYPVPLRPGDRIAVTSPSSGVRREMWPRLEFCTKHLRELGYDVVIGDCMDGSGVTSAPAPARAAELTAMLLDPAIRAVVPPWGGELAIDLLPLLDFEAISAAQPTWLVGYSDLTTVMVPLTLRIGIATLHGSNLMEPRARSPSRCCRGWPRPPRSPEACCARVTRRRTAAAGTTTTPSTRRCRR